MFLTLLVATAIVAAPGAERLRMSRRRQPVDEQQFYSAVHAELRAGSSLRQSIAAAAGSQHGRPFSAVRRAALVGAPMAEIALSLRLLPNSGDHAAAALTVAAFSGGRAADVFLRLADRAAADADLERQRRVLTAQSRLSASIVGGLPVVWLVFGGFGRLATLVAAGGASVAVIGIGMEALGVALIWRLAST